jgi:hypothetical protein
MCKIMTWWTALALAGAVAGFVQPPAVRTAGSQDGAIGSRGQVVEVPGQGALNAGGYAVVASVSCAPAGTCSADADYTDRHDDCQGFVVSQTG